MLLQTNDHILFYGDSITDSNRLIPETHGLGTGYASQVAAILGALYPEMNFKFTNTGISGNRIYDLEQRLAADVLAHHPTVVSILIGINDTWRRYDSNMSSPIYDFQNAYRRILQSLRDHAIRPVILEPFLLPLPEDRKAWREDLDPRIQCIRELAVEFHAPYLPLDGMFAAASVRQKAEYWMPDGVHPTRAGHGLIAEAWVDLMT